MHIANNLFRNNLLLHQLLRRFLFMCAGLVINRMLISDGFGQRLANALRLFLLMPGITKKIPPGCGKQQGGEEENDGREFHTPRMPGRA